MLRSQVDTALQLLQNTTLGDGAPRREESTDKGVSRRKRVSKESAVSQTYTDAGKLNFRTGPFLGESNSGWGANLDMIGLAHGPVGCGGFTQTMRLNLPSFVQGVESFTALHACTDLRRGDLEDGGDARLLHALDEAEALFPLARGVTILNEDPLMLVDTNMEGIAKTKTKVSGLLIIPRMLNAQWDRSTASRLKAAGSHRGQANADSKDVALSFYREAPGLVWIVSKLLFDIGLNAVHEITGSSASDMARIGRCGIVLGFSERTNVPDDFMPGGNAQLLRQWFDMRLVWSCFVSPSATDASLRLIANCFDSEIRQRVEQVIAVNRKKIDAVIARFRPRLQGKLVIHFEPMTEEQLEPYRLLGMRVGNASGWTGKTGAWRVPRLVCDPNHPSEKAINSYISEAKPDLILHFGHNEGHGEFDWRKRGHAMLPFTSLFDRKGNAFWGYDGFACHAAALDRAINASWRKLMNPPWPKEDGP